MNKQFKWAACHLQIFSFIKIFSQMFKVILPLAIAASAFLMPVI